MAVDVSGSPPGGVDISGEGSEGCTGHQRIRRIQRPGLAPLQPHCVGRDSRTRSGYGLPIHGNRGTTVKLPKAATFSSEVVCFYMFLRKFRGESVQIKSEESYIGHYDDIYLRAAAPAADPGRIGKEAKQIGIKTLRCFVAWGFRPFSYVYCCEIYLIGLNFHV